MTGITPATSTLYQNGDVNFREKPSTRFAVSLPQFLKDRGYRIVNSGKVYHNTPDLSASNPTGITRRATDWDDSFAGGLIWETRESQRQYPGDNFSGLRLSLPGPTTMPGPWASMVYSSGTNIDTARHLLAMREGMNDFRAARYRAANHQRQHC
jgi:hypothetical protein